MLGWDIGKEGYLGGNILVERMLRAADNQVGADTKPLQFLHRVLRRLGLLFANGAHHRHQRGVDEHHIGVAFFAV